MSEFTTPDHTDDILNSPRAPINPNGSAPEMAELKATIAQQGERIDECEKRIIRQAQAVAALLSQAAQPQITQNIISQLLNTEQPIQGAPPVVPDMPPGM